MASTSVNPVDVNVGNVNVSIRWADITTLKDVDAIVNAANESLEGGGGIDGAIHDAAGKYERDDDGNIKMYDGKPRRLENYDFLRECLEIPILYNKKINTLSGPKIISVRCPKGQARITKSYYLRKNDVGPRFVIHSVGPNFNKLKPGADRKPYQNLLKSAYKNSLKIARNHRLPTVALPAISSNLFGGTADEVAKEAYNAISDHGKMEHPIVQNIIIAIKAPGINDPNNESYAKDTTVKVYKAFIEEFTRVRESTA